MHNKIKHHYAMLLNEARELVRKHPFLAKPVYTIFNPEKNAINQLLWKISPNAQGILEWPELRELRKIVRRGSLDAPPQGARGVDILVSNLFHGAFNGAVGALLSAALMARGANVKMLNLRNRIPFLEQLGFYIDSRGSYQARVAKILGVPVVDAGLCCDFDCDDLKITNLDIDELQSYIHEGVPLGRMARITLRWSLRKFTLENNKEVVESYRELIRLGYKFFKYFNELLQREKPDVVLLFNGLFLPERILFYVAQSQDIPVVTWEGGWLPDTILFSWENFAGYCELDEVWQEEKDANLSENQIRQMEEFLAVRWRGGREVAQYWPKIQADIAKIKANLEIDGKIYSIFSNILWDSSIQDRDLGFTNMMEWLLDTIDYFTNKDEHLVIRLHPAEIRLYGKRSNEPVGDFIRRHRPNLAKNIHIIPPESDLSSYSLMSMSEAVLVYTSTAGLEAALMGKPALVCAQTHYRNKGFTLDVENKSHYYNILDRLRSGEKVLDLDDAKRLAYKYAYLLFFRHMIPFPFVSRNHQFRPVFNMESLAELRAGADEHLDFICDNIMGLKRRAFVLPR